MSIYTRCVEQLRATRISSTFGAAIFLSFCTSCSTLWQPWIDTFDRSGPEAGVTTPACDGGGAGCDSPDMLPSAPPDMTKSICSATPPLGGVHFTKTEQVGMRFLRGVHGKDVKNVWTVGDGGTVAKWDGTHWQTQDGRTNVNLFGIWGDRMSDMVAVGELGTSIRLEGGVIWVPYAVAESGDAIRAIWGTNSTNLWASGTVGTDKGFILHWTGGFTLPARTPTEKGLVSMWGTDAGHLWAARTDGQVEQGDGTNWMTRDTGTKAGLTAVWGTEPSNLWMVGDSGTILKWDGKTWTAQTSNTPSPLLAIWGFDSCNIWAVGRAGAIVWWNGSAWTSQKQAGMDLDLGGVWGDNARDLWMVGDKGTVIHLTPP